MTLDVNLTDPALIGQYPAGVITRPVHLGGAVSVEAGVPLTVRVVTESSRALIHLESGWRLEKVAHRSISPLTGELVWWETATTDQSGAYLDAETRQVIVLGEDEHTHLYTTTLTVFAGETQVGEYEIGPYPVPTGDRSVYDLDTNLIPDGTAEGTLVAIPDIWRQIIADAAAIADLKGQPGGIAELDEFGQVVEAQLPLVNRARTRVWTPAGYPARIPGVVNIFIGEADPGSAKLPGDVWAKPDPASISDVIENIREQASTIFLAPSGDDDTALLNDVLSASQGKTISLKAGTTFRTSATLNVPSGVIIEGNGATIDATALPAGTTLNQRFAIRAAGSVEASKAITNPIPAGSRVVTGIAGVVGITAGDLVLISNDERPLPGMTRIDRDKGELHIVQSVDSENQVTLASGVMFAYGTVSLTIRKVNAVENVMVKDLTLLCGGIGSAHNGVSVRYGRNVTVSDVVIKGAEDTAVSISAVWNAKVNRCTISDSTSSVTLGNTGYGVAVVDGSRHVVVDSNHFRNCRHFIAGGGSWPAVYVDAVNNHGEQAGDAAYDVHESCFYWSYRFNTSIGGSNGFIIRGQHIKVEGNVVQGTTGFAYKAATFDGVTEQRGIEFVNNAAENCAFGLLLDGQAVGAEPACLKIDAKIVGTRIGNCGPNPILLRHFDGGEVSGNTVTSATGDGIAVLGLSATPSKNLTMVGNIVRNTTARGIRIDYVDGVNLTGGSVSAPSTHGVALLGCSRSNISGMTVRNPLQYGIFIDGGSVHAVTGALISGGVNASYDAVRVSGSADVTISGGHLASARYAVYSTTTDNVMVTGVNVRSAANATRISVDATNKVVANNLI